MVVFAENIHVEVGSIVVDSRALLVSAAAVAGGLLRVAVVFVRKWGEREKDIADRIELARDKAETKRNILVNEMAAQSTRQTESLKAIYQGIAELKELLEHR